MINKKNLEDVLRLLNFYKKGNCFFLKTDGPLRANFRRIKQGGYPSRSVDVKISAECHHFS